MYSFTKILTIGDTEVYAVWYWNIHRAILKFIRLILKFIQISTEVNTGRYWSLFRVTVTFILVDSEVNTVW